ncbi:uncharacterized protein CEXT_387081 [Caerostris extrusa]|uniref:Uncharacterized protein n=1 Tax=Caerostris extrusa TaxID=172846 RepID=A0AAV4P6S7_CAEEX|nr:uncharacterized protein CEXT_387081 [Caerostris extrusa]
MLNGSLYADDLCHGADNVESAFNLSSDANGLCEENSFEKDNVESVGLVWNMEEDMLRVDVRSLLESFKFLENTKRSVLSTAAMVFDPVGFLSPFVVRIKRLMQEIWEGIRLGFEVTGRFRVKVEKWCAEIEV